MSRKEIDAEKLTACKTSMQEMNKRFEGEITGLIQSSATESMQGAEDIPFLLIRLGTPLLYLELILLLINALK